MSKLTAFVLVVCLALVPAAAVSCMSPDQIEEDRVSAEELRTVQAELATMREKLATLERYMKRDAEQTANMMRARRELQAGIQRLEAYLRSLADEQ